MKHNNAIEAALKYVVQGTDTDIPFSDNKYGRPSSKRIVNGVVLERVDYDVYLAMRDFWNTARKLMQNDGIMTDEEWVAYQKKAAPMVNKRMIDMALVSDDLKAVRAVAADLADRGYGKAATQINVNVSDKDIRGAWKQIEDRGIIDVTNLIEVDNA
jgi:hypothetical protein